MAIGLLCAIVVVMCALCTAKRNEAKLKMEKFTREKKIQLHEYMIFHECIRYGVSIIPAEVVARHPRWLGEVPR